MLVIAIRKKIFLVSPEWFLRPETQKIEGIGSC